MRKKSASSGIGSAGDGRFGTLTLPLRALLFAAVLAAAAGCASLTPQQIAMQGKEAPSTRFTMLDGRPLSLEELRGKRVLLLFWTSWCSHSRPAIEEFNELAGEHKNRKDLYFLAASVDSYDGLADVEGRIKSEALVNLNHAFSGNDLQDEAFILFNADRVPFFVTISTDGRVEKLGPSISVVESAIR
jgi:thiol-disulfide isomerase/thioredoxin